MKSPFSSYPTTRREFLQRSGQGLGLLAFSSVAPRFLTESAAAQAPMPEKDRSILVLVQLAGGNDGLNTVIPYQDDQYYRLRPRLGIKATDGIHKLNDTLALNPACTDMARLYKEGNLSIVQNVGYPNPNRSHFRSSEIWETASNSEEFLSTGWLGRFFDNACPGSPETSDSPDPAAVHISGQTPQAFLSQDPHNLFGVDLRNRNSGNTNPRQRSLLEGFDGGMEENNLSFLQHTMMDALVAQDRIQSILSRYRPKASYPGNSLGQSLRRVAGLIAAGMETRVYFVSHTGYDTHANQPGTHSRLMRELSASLAAFQKDLVAHKLDDQVLTMTFSEFGRRPSENASIGTDHGTAAPLFVMGKAIRSPLVGQSPDLNVKQNQDLTHSTDFRQVYSTILQKWLDTDPKPVLGTTWSPLPFLA